MNDLNPSTLAKGAKVAARLIQRTRWVMNIQAEITAHTVDLEMLAKSQERTNKTLAVVQYKHEQAEKTNDPRVEDTAKVLESEEKHAKEQTEQNEKETKTIEKAIKKCEDTIKEVESGKKKVSAEKMTELAKELVHGYVESALNDEDYTTSN